MLSDICPQISINLKAVKSNYLKIKKLIGSKSVCSAVIKNNAYGLGAKEIGITLYNAGCRDFWVAYLSEAIEARDFLPLDANIYFFQGFNSSCIDYVKKNSITPVINSISEFKVAKNHNINLVLHVDSGLTRLGLRSEDIEAILEELPFEKLKYVISHLAASDDWQNPLNDVQRGMFNKILEKVRNVCKSDIKAGLSASSKLLTKDEYKYDIVRCGAFLYGIHSEDIRSENVLSLVTKILQKYYIPGNTYVGYGATYCSATPIKVAVISIGYADGIKRNLSNKGCVLFYDKFGQQYKAKILGRISMDLLVCDITDIPDNLTDIHQPAHILDDTYTINEMGSDANTIPYEILTSINFKSNRAILQYTN